MTTTVCVIGTVATDPKLVTPASGVPFCTFRIASNDRHFNREKNQWVQGNTNWLTVTLFRSLAEHAKASLQKGERIVVNGRLRIKDWSTPNSQGTNVEIEADAIGHDLRWGTSTFTRQTVADASGESEHGDAARGEHAPGQSGGAGRESGEDRWHIPVPATNSGVEEVMSPDGFTPQVAAA